MTARLHDEARRILFDEAKDLDAARAAAAKLTEATRRLLYVELEGQLARAEIGQLDEASPTVLATSELPTTATATSAQTVELPYMEAKRRAIEAFDREYLSRVMAASNHSVTHAARAAGVERRNFRKMLQRHGLRPRGVRTTKAEPDAKYTDQILKILDENPQGLRTYEIAEKTKQPLSNAFGILKLLKRQGRIERHGERYNTLWTLRGVAPVPRIETIPAAAVAVLSKASGAVDARRLCDEICALLQGVDKPPTQAALNRGISRLVSNGTIAVHGANERGGMYVLAPKGDASNLN